MSAYKTQAWLYPDADLALHVTCNGPSTADTTWALTLILMYVSDVFLREVPWLNTTTLCSFPEPWSRPVDSPEPETLPPPLPDDALPEHVVYYEGKYSHPSFGEVRIIQDNNTGKLMFYMGEFMQAILHYNAKQETFYTNLTGKYWYSTDQIPMQFKPLPDQGSAVHLHMPLYAPYETAERTTFFREGHIYNFEPGPSVNTCFANSSLPRYATIQNLILVIVTMALVYYH